jgi:NAD(P)-dependent dehydrogenase (short-subunit alcohol dehydrogenase family)
MQLKNKVAVITGGSKGIGLATAQLFAKEGAKVVITGRDISSLEKAKETITEEILAIQCDTQNLVQINQLFHQVSEAYGKVDVLFVNAGIAQQVRLVEVTEEIFDRMDNINHKGAYFTVQKSLPYLNDEASIILNASIAAIIGYENHSVYSATKAAL